MTPTALDQTDVARDLEPSVTDFQTLVCQAGMREVSILRFWNGTIRLAKGYLDFPVALRNFWSAPVPGRSIVRRAERLEIFQNHRACGRCCGRDGRTPGLSVTSRCIFLFSDEAQAIAQPALQSGRA